MRIDIHVHSKYSKRPSQWILKKVGCSESYTEPLQIYQIAKNKGMTHVTIADHNSIDGALDIAHLPDAFISEEITTYFPEDGCKVHVLALNISEAQHSDIQHLRRNIYDLAVYLKTQNVLSIVAHPLYAVNEKLTIAHFEQLLLLFENFELNGARNERENACMRQVAANLSPAIMDSLTERHGIAPLYPPPRHIRLWGGSDDHSSLNIARTYTRIDGFDNPQSLTMTTAAGCEPEAIGLAATPLTMAHNLYSIAYQYYRNKFTLHRYADKDVLMRFFERNLRMDQNAQPGLISRLYMLWHYRREQKIQAPVSDSLMTLLRRETSRLIQSDPAFFLQQDDSRDSMLPEQHWYDFVNLVSKRVMLHFGNNLLDHLSGANLFNIFTTIGSAGGLYTLLAPYFVAFAQFSKDNAFSEKVGNRFAPEGTCAESKKFKMAHFTDTFHEVNGVAQSLRQQIQYAIKNNKDYTLVTCSDTNGTDHAGVRNFQPIGTYAMPEYPELQIFYPPLLEMLTYCYEGRFDQIHTATPGPVGLAALAVAKILKLPISGTYHTAIPQYTEILTGDEAMAEATWKYVLWYYNQLDLIYAPSRSTMEELISKGIDPQKIKLYPRGIDVELYHPAKRNGIFKTTFPLSEGVKLLYVGRISKEKNLELLVAVFKNLVACGEKVQLVVVGDGPYLAEMKADLEGLPCCFTGYLQNEKLAAAYASADIFIFPSTTDTFGNVVLEAQASGLPVIVSDLGGPCENIIQDTTGLVCKADDVQGFCHAAASLVHDPARMRMMGRAARRYVEARSFENAFLNLWDLFQKPIHTPATTGAAAQRFSA